MGVLIGVVINVNQSVVSRKVELHLDRDEEGIGKEGVGETEGVIAILQKYSQAPPKPIV